MIAGLKSSSAPTFRRQSRPGPTGFIAMDAGFALALALVLLMLMSVILVRQRAAEKQLAEIRALNREAERALLAVQAGAPRDSDLQWKMLPAPAPAGFQWVQVTVADKSPTHAGLRVIKSASLVGLLPVEHGGSNP